jgi:hypothetical protein
MVAEAKDLSMEDELGPTSLAGWAEAVKALELSVYRLEWYREKEGITGIDAIELANEAIRRFCNAMLGEEKK